MASTKKFGGWPVPGWFSEEGCQAFIDMDLRDDDVVMVSYVKAGTTWVNKIIHSLLRLDENGKPQEGLKGRVDLGATGQIYPDWLTVDKPDDPDWPGVGPGGLTGKVCFKDLLDQPQPRLFSTHCADNLLPKALAKNGRLVYVLRNPKDCLNSLHYFRGEAKDGWLGNEHGPGSLERFVTGVNAYGSIFDHVARMQQFMDTNCPDRSMVVYYEDLVTDLRAGIQKLAKFLNVPLSDAKLEAIYSMTTFSAMSAGTVGKISQILCRKGVAGDWVNAPLSDEHWARVEKTFEETIGSLPIAQPLRKYMQRPIEDTESDAN
eukprot:CAMPEP_0206434564 /NCGR_PEP_ID=MMETSP0324_2-20121206/9248_1 /ASSEMBLY_ACC=CAM_ASM_000836 /TAXON_ID=2866 /ORGANISM="Crypthecodinium cohnii, Strain Seligo" /LENGTH=317 /DNA_ID=CAMNT_0053901133 /DNA_START=40 /DNA_END=993 /DNA_ORIENTATION=+